MMKIEAKWRGGMHFQSNSPSHHTVEFDSGPRDSVTHGPAPMEMILQALAACSGMDIIAILQKKRKEPELFEISIHSERADTHPKVFTKVAIHYRFKRDGLTKKDAEQAIRLSVDKYCSILSMIRSSAEVTWDYEILA